jgi:microcystin-dependent protein
MAPYIGEIILVGFNFAPAGYAFCDGQLLPIAENETLFQLIGTTFGGDGETNFALPDLRSRVPIHMGQGPGLSSFTLGEWAGVETVTLLTSQIPAHTHVIDVSTMTGTRRCRNAAATTTSPVGAVPANDLAGPFVDDTLTPIATVMKTAHVTELRSRVDNARIANGLTAYPYADPVLTAATTAITAQHVIDLRTAVNAVYSTLGMALPSYTDPSFGAGTPIKAVHINELRSAATAVAPSGTALRYSNGGADANMLADAVTVSGNPTAAISGSSQPHNNMQPYLTLNYCISLFGIFPNQF